jgi:hypothetical protein
MKIKMKTDQFIRATGDLSIMALLDWTISDDGCPPREPDVRTDGHTTN